jgi:transposase
MVHTHLKLRLTASQTKQLDSWLWNLTSVWNWAIKKIEADAHDSVYYSPFEFQTLLANHSEKLEIPSHTLQGILAQAHKSWKRCFEKIANKLRLKGRRNKMCSIPFPDPINRPIKNCIKLPIIGKIRFHKQDIHEGKIKCGRIIKRASGWYLCLSIDTDRIKIIRKASGSIGIDPGFNNLLVLSTGEKIEHPRELEAISKRLSQAQRGGNKSLTARLQERRANRVKDRNHKLSLRLVQHNSFIAFSKDNHKGIASKFGRSVSSSSHYQLQRMIAYKSRSGGTQYVETEPKFSTMTCSICGARNGPKGLDGLAVRIWECTCGARHDRDINAACNVLKSGLGYSLKEISNELN